VRGYTSAILKVVILVVIGIIIANDVGNYLMTQRRYEDKAKEVAQEALRVYTVTRSQATAELAAKKAASDRGVKLAEIEFKTSPVEVDVVIDAPVENTIVLHRIKALKKLHTSKIRGEAYVSY
jgi:hypothetical protein